MTTEQRRIQDHLKVIWRWKLLVVPFVVIIPTGIYLVVAGQTKTYQSSVLLQVQTPVGDALSPEQTVAPAQNLLSAARLITTTRVAEVAAAGLREPRSEARRLLMSVMATADTQAGFITIVARAAGAKRAADIANAFAAAVARTRTSEAVRRLNATIADVARQRRELRRADQALRKPLSVRLQRLRALRVAQDANTQIVEPAVASGSPIAPRVARTVLLSAIVALLLALAAVVLAHAADRRIREPLELEELTDGPLLSVVPRGASDRVQAGLAGDEAFRTLRACLTSFNAVAIRSVLVCSPCPRDGRTTVATNLARAMARAGSDVILVDADLRGPQVASRFDVVATVGLGGVLSGEATLHDALVDLDVGPAGGGRLRLLVAEPGLSNPSEMLASVPMSELIEQLTGMSGIVIVDSAPLLTVSDALPLVGVVSGVVAVARLNLTSRDSIRRFERIVRAGGGTLLGAVATGASAPRDRGLRAGRRRVGRRVRQG